MAKPDNKDYILQKTFFLMLIKGYDGVSITDIQKETGMSRGIIYHYYNSKEELFRAAAEKFLVSPFITSIAETQGYTIPDMIRFVTKKYMNIPKIWRNYIGASQISMANYDFLFYQMIQKEKPIAKTYYRTQREGKRAWTEAVKLSLEKKEIRHVLKAEKIAMHFILLLDGVWMDSTESGSINHYVKLTSNALQDYYELLKI